MQPVVHPVSFGVEKIDSLLTIGAPNVIVESVKWAEEGKAFIVRLYEVERSGVRTDIRFGVPVESVEETNML